MRRRLAILLTPILVLALVIVGATHAASAATCPTPVGTANLPPEDPEPTVPIWCTTTPTLPQFTGAQDGFGGWIDQFDNTVSGLSPAHLNDGEIGYRAFEGIGGGGTTQSAHWEANGYFVADLNASAPVNGDDLSPNLAFHFQNRKLVIEGDVAVEAGFGTNGDLAWPEMAWSTLPVPHLGDANGVNDVLYLYGYFPGGTTAGCRLQGSRGLTCAEQADHVLSSTTHDQPPCFSDPPSRLFEISWFQQCGSTHSGLSVLAGAPSNAWRQCPVGTVDPCLDRFRLEWSQNGLVAYVNGIKFGEDSGWPAAQQFPEAIVNGSVPVYAHFGDFSDSIGNVYRFHWARIAVNPHNPDGSAMGPSASPTFGQVPPTPTPSPSSTPTATPTVTPRPTPSMTPTATPIPSPTVTPCSHPTPHAHPPKKPCKGTTG